ncbi:1044_t:CDS:2 [Acaulospora colombiana]|uniref:1044_t:CDS:1 n=1 Tax=Acaulospora colombiana TaxID=27376 RepID=A0ACA9MEQ8_9GLOM|nr:1044_t:CDS:2 [Acaulospora colombiana]
MPTGPPPSVPTTPPPSGTTRANTSDAVVTRSVTSRASTTSTRTSATATATPESDGMSLGSIAGAAAAAIIGIGVITAFVIWFIRRRKRNSDIDEEPFNRNSFLRQSTVIPDDDAPPPSRTRPAPGPSMVERQPTPLYGAPNPYNDMGNDGFGYNTQPSYNGAPGQMYNGGFGPGGAPATPLPNTPGFGTAYDQGFNNNGGYAELTRGNTPHDYPPSPRGYEQYNHHLESPAAPSFAGRDNFPSPPPTAHGAETVTGQDAVYKSGPTYPELTPATATAQQGQFVTVKESAHDGRETPVQLGFAPAQTQPKAPAPTAKKQRPESSMYNEDDAYGGM